MHAWHRMRRCSLALSPPPLLFQLSLALGVLLTGLLSYRTFGWRVFKMFGTQRELRRIYMQLLSTYSILKLDITTTVLAIIQTQQLVLGRSDGGDGTQIGFYLFIIIYDLVERVGAFRLIRAERKKALAAAAPFALALPIFLLYLVYALYESEQCGRYTRAACPLWLANQSNVANCLACGYVDRLTGAPANATYTNISSGVTLRCLEPECGTPDKLVAQLVFNKFAVLLYNPVFARVWEQPVYSVIFFHVAVRLLALWATHTLSRSFGKGLKGFRMRAPDVQDVRIVRDMPTRLRGDRNVERCLQTMLTGSTVRIRESADSASSSGVMPTTAASDAAALANRRATLGAPRGTMRVLAVESPSYGGSAAGGATYGPTSAAAAVRQVSGSARASLRFVTRRVSRARVPGRGEGHTQSTLPATPCT